MADCAAEARRILMALDVNAMRKLHAHLSPHFDGPGTDDDVLAGMHAARTFLDNIPISHREYSHRWLLERGLPSQLPNEMRARAEQVEPRVVEGVGIMVAASSEELEPAALLVRGAMEHVVLDAYADSSSPDPNRLHERMMDARRSELRGLVLPDLDARE